MTTTILLGNIPMFANLPPAVLAPLQAACHSVRLERGEVLFHFGDKGREMYIVETGNIRIWVKADDGHEIHLADLGENQVLGELEMIDGKARSASATATEPTRLIALPRDALFQQLGQNPGMALHLMVSLSERLRASNVQQMQMRASLAPAEKRLAGFLLTISENSHDMRIKQFRLDATAKILGITPAVLQQLLQDWITQEVIGAPNDNEIDLYKPEVLQQIAEWAVTPVG